MIPYGAHNISEADISAVTDVLRSSKITQGGMVPEFERALADYVGARYAIAVNSGTSALHLACLALDVGPGDVVWTSANTFVASANCARYCGADVDFVDICPSTLNLDPQRLKEKLEEVERIGGQFPKVLITVHFAGRPCAQKMCKDLADRYGIRVIEDASHALGAMTDGCPVGACDNSDLCVFSFHPVKMITTGEGGVVTTNSPEIANCVARLRSHGITRDSKMMEFMPHGGWYYEQTDLGFNYRMTDIQAALGRSQLRRLDEFVAERARLATRYEWLLKDTDIGRQPGSETRNSAWHIYVIRVPKATRRQVYESMWSDGIAVNVHYMPVYCHPYYRKLGFAEGYCPEAEAYYYEAVTIPLFPGLSDGDQDYVVQSLFNGLSPRRETT